MMVYQWTDARVYSMHSQWRNSIWTVLWACFGISLECFEHILSESNEKQWIRSTQQQIVWDKVSALPILLIRRKSDIRIWRVVISLKRSYQLLKYNNKELWTPRPVVHIAKSLRIQSLNRAHKLSHSWGKWYGTEQQQERSTLQK